MMVAHNEEANKTAYTVTVDYKIGTLNALITLASGTTVLIDGSRIGLLLIDCPVRSV
jgi:hypothetical protein